MDMTSKLVSIFEERGENLSEDELLTWTVLSDVEQQIVKKLTGPGAKLISGPRGSGKSTLLKIAFFELLESRAALPVYVNFSKALALEPLFHTSANATQLFRQWVLAKIASGLKESCSKWPVTLPRPIEETIERARTYIASLETGKSEISAWEFSPSGISELIRSIAQHCEVGRAVLLLDDAAHAFSVQQQREFFEVFRELRSREISAKAAIYPGVTSFSPSFQVGHEAEEIQAWIRADSDNYLVSMHQIADKRFPELRQKLGTNYDESIDVLALASFGLPRGFVNMTSEVIDSIELGISVRKAVLDAIASNSDGVVTQFKNIADKLPRFANYIKLGVELEATSREAFREFNRGKAVNSKTATLGLSEPWNPELDRVLRFMEYAGFLRRIEDLSKGVKGNYQRYVVHYSRIISTNALFLGKNYKVGMIGAALKKPIAHALIKTKPETLLGKDYADTCTLALPPCPSCATARIAEQQKFCMNCGQELRSASVYLELLKASVEKLPIPARKVSALQAVGFTSVGQLLSDENQKFRKPGSSIGPVWTKRILNVAEEFLSV
jgi:ABC-type molybdenum transport system ATPase subunit/photorepair protein PhrA